MSSRGSIASILIPAIIGGNIIDHVFTKYFCIMNFASMRSCLLIGLITLLNNEGIAGDVRAVDATHVRLLPGSPFYDRQEMHRTNYLAAWDCDKLLFPYRALAGLPQANGVKSGYAGWDSGFIRGHMTGHYLSAASRMAAATGDKSYADKVNYLVAELGKCQDALNQDGYLAAFPSGAFDRLEGKPGNSGGVVVPYYTIQKIMSGLLDAYHYLGHTQALQITIKMADYFEKRLDALTPDQIEKIFRTDKSRNPQNEFGSMSDALTELYADTGDKRHLEAAALFNRPWFVIPLAEDKDNLAGMHGNTHIAQAVGLAHYANITGNEEDMKASENFWKIVTRDHSFVNGGNTFHEWFGKADVEVGPSVDDNKELPSTTEESCNTYNMLKLTARLFERDPRAEYADYYELALFNHLLATVAPDSGEVTYFTPLRGNFRTYINGTFCCTGTGIENPPRYNEGIYFQGTNSLWVNLYIPSELNWRETGMVIRQEGDITHGEPIKFTVAKAGNQPTTLNFRIPDWISREAVLTLNGKVQERTKKASTYLSVTRKWKAGDEIVLTLPAALHIVRAKDDASMVSVFFGPVLLAGELGNTNMPKDFGDKDAYLKTPPVAVPDIVSSSPKPTDWLKPTQGASLAFTMQNAGPADGIIFRPLYQVHHERYSVYWQLNKTSP